MKYWINAIGYGLPTAIRIMVAKRAKGNPLYRTWYGIRDVNKGNWDKVKLIMTNRYGKRSKAEN